MNYRPSTLDGVGLLINNWAWSGRDQEPGRLECRLMVFSTYRWAGLEMAGAHSNKIKSFVNINL